MEIPSAVALQLHLLSRNGDGAESFVAGLNLLAADLIQVVPSLLGVSLTLVRLGYHVQVTALATNADSNIVAASLAIPLVSAEHGDTLLLQAAEPGAFLLLADDISGLSGPVYPQLERDQHLELPPARTGRASLAFVLAELRVVNQAIGVLLDEGDDTAEAALAELGRRASAAGTSIGVASRRLLTSLQPPDDGDPDDR